MLGRSPERSSLGRPRLEQTSPGGENASIRLAVMTIVVLTAAQPPGISERGT